MKNILKTTLLLILISLLAFSLTACNKNKNDEKAILSVGNAKVPTDVFAFYLDETMQFKGSDYSEEQAIADAEVLATRYIKINTEFNRRNAALSSSEKAEIATDVNNNWNVYKKYYEKIGVSKETLTKVMTSDKYAEKLTTLVYGKGGENEKSLDSQKAYYNENYIAFKVINAYLTGEKEEDDATIKTFQDLKAKIKDDVTIDTVNAEYLTSLGENPDSEMDITVMKKGSELYTEDFFNKVHALNSGEITIITSEDFIFLVQKIDGSSLFNTYQSTILAAMAGDDFKTYVDGLYKEDTVSSNASMEKSCYNTIEKAKFK